MLVTACAVTSTTPRRPQARGVQEGGRFNASATDTAMLDVPLKSSLFRQAPAGRCQRAPELARSTPLAVKWRQLLSQLTQFHEAINRPHEMDRLAHGPQARTRKTEH